MATLFNIVFVFATAATPCYRAADISATVASSLMTILNEEKHIRNSLESELNTLAGEITALQLAQSNSKSLELDV